MQNLATKLGEFKSEFFFKPITFPKRRSVINTPDSSGKSLKVYGIFDILELHYQNVANAAMSVVRAHLLWKTRALKYTLHIPFPCKKDSLRNVCTSFVEALQSTRDLLNMWSKVVISGCDNVEFVLSNQKDLICRNITFKGKFVFLWIVIDHFSLILRVALDHEFFRYFSQRFLELCLL